MRTDQSGTRGGDFYVSQLPSDWGTQSSFPQKSEGLVSSIGVGTHCRSLAIAAEGSTAELSTPWAAFAAVLFHSYAAS